MGEPKTRVESVTELRLTVTYFGEANRLMQWYLWFVRRGLGR